MAVAQPKPKYTVDDLWELSHRTGKRYELVRGELRELTPTGLEHGFIEVNIASLLRAHVRQHGLGVVVGGEAGFVVGEDTVRAADVAFLSREKIPEAGLPDRFGQIPADLVVEILSPGDSFSAVMEKVQEWLNAGVRLVWVVDPSVKRVSVHKPGEPVRILGEGDTLCGEEVLPGFECAISELFAL